MALGLDTDLVESVSAPDFSLGVNVAWIAHDGLEEFIAFQTVVQGENDVILAGRRAGVPRYRTHSIPGRNSRLVPLLWQRRS